jgi:sugar phosphate isomerase/epimerase
MQGRLLPKYKDRFQAHPLGYWQDEFPIAAEIGLQCIEFIFDFNDYQLNPLWAVDGLKEIQNVSKDTGIKVYSVCADFFMECPFHSESQDESDLAILVAKKLIQNCSELGISDIVIPCVDQSSLPSQSHIHKFINQIHKIIPIAEKLDVHLALETDLDPSAFKNLLYQLNSPSITVNYDTGNSASLGFDYLEELHAYGDRISDLHIKDRLRGGGSVTLGTGDFDIEGFFSKFDLDQFNGPVILQCFRDDEGIALFQNQLNYFYSKIS